MPTAEPVTLTAKVHDALSTSMAPDRLTLADPAAAIMAPPPGQLPLRPLGFAATRPEGKVSLTPMSVRATVIFGFVILKLRDVEPPTRVEAAPNTSLMTGGAATVMLSDADSPFPPCVEVTTLVVFFLTPARVLVTSTVNVQLAAAPRFASDRLMLADPATAVMVPPPQLPFMPLGVETTKPHGSESVNPTPLRAGVPH